MGYTTQACVLRNMILGDHAKSLGIIIGSCVPGTDDEIHIDEYRS